ncbi:MAG: AIR synthase-related protein, partial [Planctomycetes bacterium]|nr:AIR synthase-related protein [Planctomycetota bacterium]
HKQQVARLDMEFLHHGIPSPWRDAEWTAPVHPEPALPADEDFNHTLKRLLASWDVCSKEWVIRQYDHEAQGGAVVKPLVGALSDGPGDAAVVTPILGDFRAAAVACGIKPAYSDIDPYWMAAMAIDEALRNLVAVGAPIDRAVLLDNFCWGNCNKPDRLGSLVRAAKACHDIALGYGTPFISGKDSLNNEFAVDGGTMSVPGTLLVSALSVMPDCRKAVTMDAKKPGNLVYLVGITRNELGASHYHALHGAVGNSVPKVDTVMGLKVFRAVNQTSESGLAASCHDCSEGGFAVAAAEMAFAGGFGMEIDLEAMPVAGEVPTAARLFSESASRLVLETDPEDAAKLEEVLSGAGVPFALLGKVTDVPRLVIMLAGHILIDSDINELKSVWRDALPAIL